MLSCFKDKVQKKRFVNTKKVVLVFNLYNSTDLGIMLDTDERLSLKEVR